jgi:hypothetical protein
MIDIDGKSYKVVQLDTNALSNVVKAKDGFLKILMDRYSFGHYFFSYSPFSILEIKKSNFLYGRFCELFSIVPSFLLKGYHQLWNEEISGLNYEATIDCTHFCLHDISTNGKLLNETHVDSVLNHPSLVQAFIGLGRCVEFRPTPGRTGRIGAPHEGKSPARTALTTSDRIPARLLTTCMFNSLGWVR